VEAQPLGARPLPLHVDGARGVLTHLDDRQSWGASQRGDAVAQARGQGLGEATSVEEDRHQSAAALLLLVLLELLEPLVLLSPPEDESEEDGVADELSELVSADSLPAESLLPPSLFRP